MPDPEPAHDSTYRYIWFWWIRRFPYARSPTPFSFAFSSLGSSPRWGRRFLSSSSSSLLQTTEMVSSVQTSNWNTLPWVEVSSLVAQKLQNNSGINNHLASCETKGLSTCKTHPLPNVDGMIGHYFGLKPTQKNGELLTKPDRPQKLSGQGELTNWTAPKHVRPNIGALCHLHWGLHALSSFSRSITPWPDSRSKSSSRDQLSRKQAVPLCDNIEIELVQHPGSNIQAWSR
jgi:hypothetical protein